MRNEPAGPARPEDWPVLFTKRLNAGDVEGIAALYDRDARFVAPSGDTLVGWDRIRAVLSGLVKARTRMECQVVQAVTIDDIAVLYTNFRATSEVPSDGPAHTHQRAIEVLRRQDNGTWKLIIGDPVGRAR